MWSREEAVAQAVLITQNEFLSKYVVAHQAADADWPRNYVATR